MPSNFLQFAGASSNILNDADYTSSTYRTGGATTGAAPSATHNKLFLQLSTMVYALAEVMSTAGETVSDANLSGLQSSITRIFKSAPANTAKSSAGSALTAADVGKFFECTGTFTMAFSAAATLKEGWWIYVKNAGTGIITIDPDSGELIDGQTTIVLLPGQGVFVFCTGTGFYTIGRRAEYAHLADQKSAGTAGGTFTNGAWQTRALAEISDPSGFVTVSANQFTLQPGRYKIDARCPAYGVNFHQARLWNVTDSSVPEGCLGSNASSNGGNTHVTESFIKGQFAITAQKTFQIQHQCQTTVSTDGFGPSSPFTTTEVYTQVELTRL